MFGLYSFEAEIARWSKLALYGNVELVDRPHAPNVIKLDKLQIPTLRKMQRYGFRIDIDAARDLGTRLTTRMASLRREIVDEIPGDSLDRFIDMDSDSDETDNDAIQSQNEQNVISDSEKADDEYRDFRDRFNVESSQKISELLFNVFKLGDVGVEIKRTKGGKASTGKKTLEQLKRSHPIVGKILEYREHAKLYGTYVRALPIHSIPHPKGPDCPVCGRKHYTNERRVHTSFATTRAVTGRICSRKPNLANIPARTKLGAEIRRLFIPSEGYKIVQRDWAQIELRLMADRSRDPVMIDVYANDGDIHITTAMKTFNIDDPTKVDKLLHRAPSKNTNFAVCLAKGQHVLTSKGNVLIENIQPDMLLWDGIEWVHHDGVIFKGYQEVITYDGITATPDHKVWVQDGRVLPIAQAMAERLPLAVTAVERTPIRYTCDRLRSRMSSPNKLHRLRKTKSNPHRVFKVWVNPALQLSPPIQISRPPGTSTPIAAPVHSHSSTVQQPQMRFVPQLWSTWGTSEVQNAGRVCTLCTDSFAARYIHWRGHRAQEQQRALRTGKYPTGVKRSELTQSTRKSLDRLQGKTNRHCRPLRQTKTGLPTVFIGSEDHVSTGLTKCSLEGNPFKGSTRLVPVYDILNAGPRRRFTCEGKLVSNCYLITGQGLLDLMAVTFATANKPLPEWMNESWCNEFIQKWFGVYKGVRTYLTCEEESIRRYGMAWTRMGRVRLIPGVKSALQYVREAGTREGSNHGIQGFSADLMKLALGEINERVHNLESIGISVYSLMSVYDELLCEALEDDCDVVQTMLGEVMDNVLVDRQTGILQCAVPIQSDGKIMSRWEKE